MNNDQEEPTYKTPVRPSVSRKSSQAFNFNVPRDLIKQILISTTVQTLGRFSQTCKEAKEICEDDKIWKPFLIQLQLHISNDISYKKQVKEFYEWLKDPALLTVFNFFTPNLRIKVEFETPEENFIESENIVLNFNEKYQFYLVDFVKHKNFQKSLSSDQLMPSQIILTFADKNFLNPNSSEEELCEDYEEVVPTRDLLALTVRIGKLNPIREKTSDIESVKAIAHNMGLENDCTITKISSEEFEITPNSLYPQFSWSGKFLRKSESLEDLGLTSDSDDSIPERNSFFER